MDNRVAGSSLHALVTRQRSVNLCGRSRKDVFALAELRDGYAIAAAPLI
jgi:hypothetical protein